jgi:hypothetical protein
MVSILYEIENPFLNKPFLPNVLRDLMLHGVSRGRPASAVLPQAFARQGVARML